MHRFMHEIILIIIGVVVCFISFYIKFTEHIDDGCQVAINPKTLKH